MQQDYKVSKKLDYLVCSVTSFMIADDGFGKPIDTRPRQRNYNKAIEYPIGMIVQWHTERESMKINIVCNGATLASIRSLGMTDYDILHWLRSLPNCKFSRVDVAVTSERIDGKKHGFLPHVLHHVAMNGLLKSRMKVDKPAVDPELKVETSYIGSRKARNRLFRAYDKGLERGQVADYVARYELETRKNANHIATELHEKRTDIGALIRRYVDFPTVETWVEIMGADVSKNYRIEDDRPQAQVDKEKHNARLNWLFNSVAPALARILDYEDEHSTEGRGSERIIELLLTYTDYHRDN